MGLLFGAWGRKKYSFWLFATLKIYLFIPVIVLVFLFVPRCCEFCDIKGRYFLAGTTSVNFWLTCKVSLMMHLLLQLPWTTQEECTFRRWILWLNSVFLFFLNKKDKNLRNYFQKFSLFLTKLFPDLFSNNWNS